MDKTLDLGNNWYESDTLQVYDIPLNDFRKIDAKKFTEYENTAVVIFDYKALQVLEKYYIVCGFVIIDPIDHVIIPLDIQTEHICIFESQFNLFLSQYSLELKQYNITKKPDVLFSQFFIKSQFAHDDKCIEENGSFIELCSMILDNPQIIKKVVNNQTSLYQPRFYDQLCTMVQRITKLSGINWWKLDYLEKYQYLLDSLLNGYRIKLTDDEIWAIWNQVCREILKHWEEI